MVFRYKDYILVEFPAADNGADACDKCDISNMYERDVCPEEGNMLLCVNNSENDGYFKLSLKVKLKKL